MSRRPRTPAPLIARVVELADAIIPLCTQMAADPSLDRCDKIARNLRAMQKALERARDGIFEWQMNEAMRHFSI